MAKTGALATQVGGSHYDFEIQPIEYIVRNGLDFIQGNCVKYISRHKRKNKDEDVKKVLHYALLSLQLDYNYTPKQINDVLKEFMTNGGEQK